jgi:drug/metabolite transporter (DMT)-like permease
MMPYLALALMVVLTTLGQVFIKKGAGELVFHRGPAALVRSFFNPNVLTGGAFVLFAPVAYLYALTALDLRVAFSFNGLSYVLVFLSGCWIFKERITPWHVAGILVVVAGVVVFNL